MKHLLSIDDLGRDGILHLLEVAKGFQRTPLTDVLAGKTVVNCFFENSTRTRVSFELAAKRLGALTVQFGADGSSISKGESFRKTIDTIAAMGVDVLVVRHRQVGAAADVASWTNASVINAGDGTNEHPTQGLLDCMALLQHIQRRDLVGMKIAFIGDLDHSRVSGSTIRAFRALGASVSVVGPPSLTNRAAAWQLSATHDLDAAISDFDVFYTIRPQAERMIDGLIDSMDAYVDAFSITSSRLAAMQPHALVMEAGPLVPGIQMSDEVASSERCLIDQQVACGVPMRMAVLAEVMKGAGI